MKLTCQNPDCHKTFEASRVDAQFCSGACKVKSHRLASKNPPGSGSDTNIYTEMVKADTGPPGEEGPLGPDDSGLNAPDGPEGTPGDTYLMYEGQIKSEALSEDIPEEWTGLTKDPWEPKVLTTGENTIPVSSPSGWTRPRYWMRLRDLDRDEAELFCDHLRTTGRPCPTDPTLPSHEQDFYHPWAYSEWKNPNSPPAPPNPKETVPLIIPKGESQAELKERLGRIKSYNSEMEPRHHLSKSKLGAILEKAGYSPKLANQVFLKQKAVNGPQEEQE